MPLMPENSPEPVAPSLPGEDAVPSRKPARRLFSACFAMFTLLVGLLLVILPWGETWNLNYAQRLVPALQAVWDGPSFRGAVTGLGALNIYLALLEMGRLRKRA
jgi:hypothetical protein